MVEEENENGLVEWGMGRTREAVRTGGEGRQGWEPAGRQLLRAACAAARKRARGGIRSAAVFNKPNEGGGVGAGVGGSVG